MIYIYELLIFIILILINDVKPILTSYGNELDQFYRYISLVDKYGSSSLNASNLYEKFRTCERNTVPELGFRHYNCRHDIRKEMTETMTTLIDHNLFRDPVVNKRYGLDCSYNITAADTMFGNATSFQFLIVQSNCKRNFNLSQGGSTFEISARTSSFVTSCKSFDFFNDTYKIYCDLPNLQALKDEYTEKTCLLVSVVIHFEHFDAFADAGDFHWSSLGFSVLNSCICGNGSVYDSTNPVCDLSRAYQKGQSAWVRPSVVFPNDTIIVSTNKDAEHYSVIHKGNRYHHLNPFEYPNTNDYAWKNGFEKYFTVSAFRKCLSVQDIHFAGESHMRYQFDITMDRYVDKLRLGRYHGDMSTGGIYFTDMTFSARMAAFIEKIDCRQKPITYVLQTGSWDLQFFPPRGFINGPYQGQAVIAALKNLRNRMLKCEKQNVRIIFMTTMPHPWCLPHDDHCHRLMNYWRNNGAINAANEFMIKEIETLQTDMIRVIDVGNILLPRFQLDEFICVDHFMCNDPPRGLQITPSGVALANEVFDLSCTSILENEIKMGWTSTNNTHFRDGQRITFDDNYFTVENGCRRRIPDKPTIKYMGMSIDSFVNVSSIHGIDIPECNRPYPSRSTKKLLQTYSTRRVYFMDSGLKRPLHSAQTLNEFNLDFDNVNFILEDDFDAIPTGPEITTKEDCVDKLFC